MMFIAVFGAGCGADIGGPCSTTSPCTDGVCDLTNPEGGLCVDPDDDSDGDGIPAKRDFCQHLAGGQYDEDLDGFGDECDACPIAPPLATTDRDGDEVESPCDPDPATPGDRIVVFDGFNSGAMPANWKASGTPWVFQGGEAKMTPASPTNFETLTAPLPLISGHIAILARYRIDRVDPTATENNASVVGIDRRPAGLTTVACGGVRIGTSDRLVLDTGNSGSQDIVDELFDPAQLYRVALRIDGPSAQCALIGDKDSGAAQANTTGENMTEAGLAVKGATVRFGYLMAVQRGPVAQP